MNLAQTPTESRAPAHLPDARRKRQDGVKTLEDLRNRCRIDEHTGCWLWAGAVTGAGVAVLWVPVGVLGNEKRKLMAAPRVGWLLAGNNLPPGLSVMRRVFCRNALCVNPEHRKVGTRSAINQTASNRGTFSSPARRVAQLKACKVQAVPQHVVELVECLLEDGATACAAADAVGINKDTVYRIRDRTHIQQTRGFPASSVFTLGTAA